MTGLNKRKHTKQWLITVKNCTKKKKSLAYKAETQFHWPMYLGTERVIVFVINRKVQTIWTLRSNEWQAGLYKSFPSYTEEFKLKQGMVICLWPRFGGLVADLKTKARNLFGLTMTEHIISLRMKWLLIHTCIDTCKRMIF